MVTGGSGFIGSHISKHLNERGLKLDNISKSNGYDLTEDGLKNYEKVDKILHLASNTFIPDSFREPETVYRNNLLTLLNVLEYSRKNSVKELVFFSSYIYGHPEYLPVDELHARKTNNPYGRSKIQCEELCNAYAEDYGMRIIILRPFNIFGFGQSEKFLIPTIIHQVNDKNSEIISLENLEPKRDFLYINDLLDAIDRIISSPLPEGLNTYNIGSGESFSVLHVAETIMNIFGANKKIVGRSLVRKNEILDCYANIEKINNDYGWRPKFRFDEGITHLKKQYTYKG
ncbi:NAD(P)-dependent oxidoreductase [Gammaproteobacteria bacterium]|nr:NAD(P)-dependent oxidoreductase [Gammaproteobacteria bacterium]